MESELAEKSVDMRLYGAFCDEELASDFGIRQSFANEGIDLSFSRRQSRDRVDDRRRRQAQRLQQFIVAGSADEKECLVAHVA